MTDKELLGAIQFELSSREWSADTLDVIAELMNMGGYSIRGVDDGADFPYAHAPASLYRAHEIMKALDGWGDSYVIASIKLPSGVIMRSRFSDGFEVYGHSAVEISIGAAIDNVAPFSMRADQIETLAVVAL